jgi:hypothetical protein
MEARTHERVSARACEMCARVPRFLRETARVRTWDKKPL